MNKEDAILNLEDFKHKDIFMYLNKDYKKELLERSIIKAGSQRKLAKLIKEDIDYPKIKQSDISFFIKRKNLRLDLILYLCDFLGMKFNQSKIIGIKGAKTSKMIFNPKIEINLSKELVQIVANLYCDGSIEKNNCYVSTYVNGCDELITRFKRNFIKCFGDLKFYERITLVNNIRIPCFIGKVLYNKFQLYKDKVPIQIISSSKEMKSAYLQAVFDDEGSIHKTHGQIRIKMKPKSYIEDIRKLVNEFGIETSKVIKERDKRYGREYYFFLISGFYNLKKFQGKINFFHPIKRRRLANHLKNIRIKNYGYNAKELVLDLLKEKGPLTVKQAAKELDRDKRIIRQHLNNLKYKNLVDYTKIKRSMFMNIFGGFFRRDLISNI